MKKNCHLPYQLIWLYVKYGCVQWKLKKIIKERLDAVEMRLYRKTLKEYHRQHGRQMEKY